MKKPVLFLPVLLLVVAGWFTGCKNFFNEYDLLSKLAEAANYTNQEPFNIRFSAKGGKISPSGDRQCRISEQISLIFNEDRDMCFLNWQVLLNGELLEPEIATNYINFENIESPETKIEIKAKEENLAIQANVVERPKIVSATPVLEQKGVFRDRTIIVMFNQEIDESSFYFTADELKELGVSTSNAFSVETNPKYYYAYWDGHDENSYVFKNIKISNYQFSNVNYLKYFTAPKLDNTNPKVLRISTKIEKVGENYISIAPPASTEVLVTISKNIATKNQGRSVTLSEDYGWPYYTNSKVDNDNPVFVDYEENPEKGFIVTAADNGQTAFDLSKYHMNNLDDLNNLSLEKLQKIGTLNAKNHTLWVRGFVVDEGSGPANIQWNLYKVNELDTPETKHENDQKESGIITNLKVIGKEGSLNANLDDPNNVGIDMGGIPLTLNNVTEDGIYRIDFTAYDNNYKPSQIKTFYFFYDNECEYEKKINFSIETVSKTKISVEPTNYHWSHLKTEINGIEVQKDTDNGIPDLQVNDKYKTTITIKETDCFGNETTETKEILLTPQPGMFYFNDGFWSSEIDFDTTHTKENAIGVVISCGENDNKMYVINKNADSYSKVYYYPIMGSDKSTFDNLGKNFNNNDGEKNYEYAVKALKIDQTSFKSTIWYLVSEKRGDWNWYIPSKTEAESIGTNKEKIGSSLNLLTKNFLTNDRYYITSNYISSKSSVDPSCYVLHITNGHPDYQIVIAGIAEVDNSKYKAVALSGNLLLIAKVDR